MLKSMNSENLAPFNHFSWIPKLSQVTKGSRHQSVTPRPA